MTTTETKTRYTAEQLIAAGGSRWQKTGLGRVYDRVYFNSLADRYGLKCSYYNSGNVSFATLNGEKISNSAAREVLADLAHGKFWYDLTTGQWQSRNLHGTYVRAIVQQIEGQMTEESGS
jgi:hypothetical protein